VQRGEPNEEASWFDRQERRSREARCVGEKGHHIVVVGVIIDAGASDRIGRARMGQHRGPTTGKQDNDGPVQAATPATELADNRSQPSSGNPIKEQWLPPSRHQPKRAVTPDLPPSPVTLADRLCRCYMKMSCANCSVKKSSPQWNGQSFTWRLPFGISVSDQGLGKLCSPARELCRRYPDAVKTFLVLTACAVLVD
jgi:hypothetical protein